MKIAKISLQPKISPTIKGIKVIHIVLLYRAFELTFCLTSVAYYFYI